MKLRPGESVATFVFLSSFVQSSGNDAEERLEPRHAVHAESLVRVGVDGAGEARMAP